MPPPSHPCDDHNRRLEAFSERLEGAEKRLDEGDTVLRSLKRIEIAVCGDEALGIPGLVSLHARVESLERGRTWVLGAAAVLGAAVPIILQIVIK